MKIYALPLLMAVGTTMLWGQAAAPKPPLPPPATTPATEEIPTETVGSPQTAPPATAPSTPGFMEPAQVKELLHKVWLAQFRINDLLGQVHADRWKMPETARKSYAQTMESLQKSLAAEEEWRVQFDARPDSLYLGFQTYVAISAVLPRLNGVATSVTQYENASFGAQYSQAGNQLFDLQQSLQPYLLFLLKNQDGLMFAAQTNLAACQTSLGAALKDRQEHATPMKNIAPVFKGTRHGRHAAATAEPPAKQESKAADTTKAAAKPSGAPVQKK